MTLPAFRPSELMAVIRETRAHLHKANCEFTNQGLPIHKCRMVLRKVENPNWDALGGIIDAATNARNRLEAIAIDHRAEIHHAIMTRLAGFLEAYPSYGIDFFWSAEEGLFYFPPPNKGVAACLQDHVDDLHAMIAELEDLMFSIHVLGKEPDESVVQWFAAAAPRLHHYLMEADKPGAIPREIPLGRPAPLDLDRLTKDLNAFLKDSHPEKLYRFSAAKGVLSLKAATDAQKMPKK